VEKPTPRADEVAAHILKDARLSVEEFTKLL
jgi:hypothetical protein